MFKVGDQVVHPMHGAGVIETVESRGEEKKEYYVLRLFSGNLKVLIPAEKADQIGVREVINENQIPGVLKVLAKVDQSKSALNWNHRYRANLEKIRTGNVFAVADVVRNLMRQELNKGLSSGEKRMLESARQILVSELVLAGKMDPEKVESLIKKVVAGG
ncbi:MAG: CarD family transcriptional regulator [Bacillota bacterium]|nr:CarD family transcriptional regulator [Bacillota bacterium]